MSHNTHNKTVKDYVMKTLFLGKYFLKLLQSVYDNPLEILIRKCEQISYSSLISHVIGMTIY